MKSEEFGCRLHLADFAPLHITNNKTKSGKAKGLTPRLSAVTNYIHTNAVYSVGRWKRYERSNTSLTVLISRKVVPPPEPKLPLR